VSTQYSLRSFLRKCPNALLARYFDSVEAPEQPPWNDIKETQVDPMVAAHNTWPEELRGQADRDFRAVQEVATEGGVSVLLEEARAWGLDFAPHFATLDSGHGRALWAFLEHRELFGQARLFYSADCLPGRSWRKQTGLPDVLPNTDDAAVTRLENELSQHYQTREGRGQSCKVEYHQREDRHYWFVYVQDYATTLVEFGESGDFERRPHRPAFELVFVHNPGERSLDVYARGQTRTVAELEAIWGKTVLGVHLEPADRPGVSYELNVLRDRRFTFPTDPADGIAEVRLRRLRLSLLGGSKRRVVLEAEDTAGVYDLFEEVLTGLGMTSSDVNVTHARIQLVFRPEDRQRARKLAFDVTYPNSCSLKYEPTHEIAKRCLVRWRIDVSGLSGVPAASSRLL